MGGLGLSRGYMELASKCGTNYGNSLAPSISTHLTLSQTTFACWYLVSMFQSTAYLQTNPFQLFVSLLSFCLVKRIWFVLFNGDIFGYHDHLSWLEDMTVIKAILVLLNNCI